MCKYSIIIPCYNVTAFLSKCLNSIFRNRIYNSEIILIDDGSTDDFCGCVETFFGINISEEITIFEYKSTYINIIRQENLGVSASRNRGISIAKGEYVLFVDPDDYIADDAIERIDKIILNTSDFDMLIMGYNKVQEDESGNVVKIEKKLPHTIYDIYSNKEAVETILPKYLGYSIENMKTWGSRKLYLPLQLEFGAVWRNIYNRKFISENSISFNENIQLNEDSMFNANCIIRANRIVTSIECLYYYTVRTSGAFMKKRGTSLVQNKLQLLEERNKILYDLKECGYEKAIDIYAGSNVMSVIELMVKCSFWSRRKVNEYINHPLVRESIRIMPRIGIKKVDIPVMMLKLGLSDLLYLLVRVAKKIGIRLTI